MSSEEQFRDYLRDYAISHNMTEEEAINHACLRGFHEYLEQKERERYEDDGR